MANQPTPLSTEQDPASEPTDEELVTRYCLTHKISKKCVDELLKRGFTSLEALSLAESSDLDAPEIPPGQRRLILYIAGALKIKSRPKDSQSTSRLANGTAEASEQAETITIHHDEVPNAANATCGANRPDVPANNQTACTGSRGNDHDVYQQHVRSLLQEQQRLSTSVPPNHPNQASWSDPQIHLSSAAGKSTSSFLDICDFVQTSVEEEVVLGSQGDQQIVVKSGPKKPRLENLTLCQWSVANLAILYSLVGDNKLQGSALMDYLSYTTKVYQLVQKYSLVSVMLYDREYRKLQASLKFRWGTDVQHLSTIHLQPRDKVAAQGSQQRKTLVPSKPAKNNQKAEICRNFNSQKGCSFAECKFKHACIIPGCKQMHSALDHAPPK